MEILIFSSVIPSHVFLDAGPMRLTSEFRPKTVFFPREIVIIDYNSVSVKNIFIVVRRVTNSRRNCFFGTHPVCYFPFLSHREQEFVVENLLTFECNFDHLHQGLDVLELSS